LWSPKFLFPKELYIFELNVLAISISFSGKNISVKKRHIASIIVYKRDHKPTTGPHDIDDFNLDIILGTGFYIAKL
jgi:hypothetical protein